MARKVGAPAGGRVHWFLWSLPRAVSKAYTVRYDYEYHNYVLIRYPEGDERRKPIDEFIIIRTSRRCWRVMYYHFENEYFEYFSEETSQAAGEHVERVYERMRTAEERERPRRD